jgi:Leucine-rich repeat (LRR) protein
MAHWKVNDFYNHFFINNEIKPNFQNNIDVLSLRIIFNNNKYTDKFKNLITTNISLIRHLKNLKILELNTCKLHYEQIESILESFDEPQNLTQLILNDNELTNFPNEILKFTKLELLDLHNNQLKTLPDEIGELKELKYLDLGNNQLTNLPDQIVELTNLEFLILNNNQLETLPNEIGKLTKLEKFDLGNNQLEALPHEIGKLTNLKYLHLNNNNLKTLPHEIGKLTNLEYLHLNNNNLKTLPNSFQTLSTLKNIIIYLQNNPLNGEIYDNVINELENNHRIITDQRQIDDIKTTQKKIETIFLKGFSKSKLNSDTINYINEYLSSKPKAVKQKKRQTKNKNQKKRQTKSKKKEI